MTSKNSSNKISSAEFLCLSRHFGIAIGGSEIKGISGYADIERFFLCATYSLKSSRIAEGFLCWLLRYGHLLSPSKVRRLLREGVYYEPSVLGGFLEFLIQNGVSKHQWKIVLPFARKSRNAMLLIEGPKPKKPEPSFLKFNVIVHSYRMDQDKFLLPLAAAYKSSIELKNRALFGSCVHADIASFLTWHPEATPYQIAKATCNHKARVFEVFQDIRQAI